MQVVRSSDHKELELYCNFFEISAVLPLARESPSGNHRSPSPISFLLWIISLNYRDRSIVEDRTLRNPYMSSTASEQWQPLFSTYSPTTHDPS